VFTTGGPELVKNETLRQKRLDQFSNCELSIYIAANKEATTTRVFIG
jgi:hypothetical protein